MAASEVTLARRFDARPSGVGAAATRKGESVFAVIDDTRAIVVASMEGVLSSASGRFAPGETEWKRLAVTPEPLALGTAGIEIVQRIRAPREWEDAPVYARPSRDRGTERSEVSLEK